MIWTKHQERIDQLPLVDGVSIYLSTQYKSSSYFHIYPNGNDVLRLGFKPTNVPLIVKKLQKASKSQFIYVTLDDLIEMRYDKSFCESVFQEMIKADNINYLSIHTSLLSERITQIKSLEYLHIYGQSTETLPDYLANIPNLKWVNITDIRLDRIPDCIFKMPKLIGLQLKVKSCMSQLTTLFNSLPNLEYLEILNSSITSIPENIENLQKLKVLSLGDNKLRKLPSTFTKLKKLEYFVFHVDINTSVDKLTYYLPESLISLTIGENDKDSLNYLNTISQNVNYLSCHLEELEMCISSITFFLNLESINITERKYYNKENVHKSCEEIFQNLAKLKELKKVFINGKLDLREVYLLQNIEDLTLSGSLINIENIGKIRQLKSLNLTTFIQFEIPTFWSDLQELIKLSFTDVTIDFGKIGELISLKELSSNCKALNIKQFLKKNTQLEVLNGYEFDENIGEEILQLKNLTSLVLNTQQFGNKLPNGINRLSNLEYLSFQLKNVYIDNPEEIPVFFEQLSKITSLRRLTIWRTDFRLPLELGLLKQLKDGYFFCNSGHNDFKPILENALIPQIELTKGYNPNEQQYVDKFYTLKKYELTDMQRIIAFGIICENFIELRHYLPNDLSQTLEKKSCFYIAGRPHGITKPQMKEQLLAKGFEVSNVVNSETTYIVIGLGLGIEEVSKFVTSGKELVLSEYVTELLNSPDDFFLLQEENQELTKQIVQLFLSEEESNHHLALQMLSGGGATRRVLNYLLVMEGCHPNLELRKEARKLFKRFASASLFDFVKNRRGWDSMKGELRYHIFDHPDLNYWDGVLAYQTYRNQITADRLRNTWTFSRDQPNTITINEDNIGIINEIPEELALVRADGITIGYYFENPKLTIEQLCQVAVIQPLLKNHFHCQRGNITQAQFNQLKKYYDKVHINKDFTIIG
jgi:hypothetical protein